MLNKLLCFMWGHQFRYKDWAKVYKGSDIWGFKNIFTIHQRCKHCGAKNVQ